MNRQERRAAAAMKRKIEAMSPAARELAISTGMELHDGAAEFTRARWDETIDRIYDEIAAELFDQHRQEAVKVIRAQLAESDLGQAVLDAEDQSDKMSRAYLATWLGWFAAAGAHRPPVR